MIARGLVILVCLIAIGLIAINSKFASVAAIASTVGLVTLVLLLGPLWQKYSVLDKVDRAIERYPNASLFIVSLFGVFFGVYEAYGALTTHSAPSARKLKRYVFDTLGYEGVVVFWVLVSVFGIIGCIRAVRRNAA